jgi:hypothetical protein
MPPLPSKTAPLGSKAIIGGKYDGTAAEQLRRFMI